ncbi:MAG: hypothetical protein J6334_10330 [Kiritimatiellae bacterium]|nr:hypothetical protein [Kiritimatiellia bacterium]
MKRFWILFAFGVLIGGLAVLCLPRRGEREPDRTEEVRGPGGVKPAARGGTKAARSVTRKTAADRKPGTVRQAPDAGDATEDQAPADEQDAVVQAVQEWESLVEDLLKEESTEPLEKRAERLKRGLEKLPASEVQVGVQGLLNLLPDESFAMVAPILLDPKADPEVLDVIFSDMLNRPESVKNGYILAISKMRDHPQFTDAMHIRTVTEMKDDGDEGK